MDEVLPCSFKIRLQNPSGKSLEVRDVHCVVVEEGSWTMPDGRKIEAKTYESKLTDHKSSWVGEEQTYTNSYSNPVVLGQVMSYNDAKWSVFWSRGSASNRAPSGSKLFTGKHVGEDGDHNRDPETVGYIVIESGHATSNGIEIETKRGSDLAVLYVQGFGMKYTFFSTPFSTTPAVAVLSQVAMDGGDGSWAILADVTLRNSMKVAVDKDQIEKKGCEHTDKQLDYIVFSAAGPVALTSTYEESEETGYQLVYRLDTLDTCDFNGHGVPCNIDNSASISSFTRIAYRMQLDSNWMWVSMHKFTDDDANLIGVPATTSCVFQTSVTQMIIQSNVESLKLGVVLEGNIEFWPNDYAMGSSGVYDWRDERNNGGSYRSMQVHVPSLDTTVFTFNR